LEFDWVACWWCKWAGQFLICKFMLIYANVSDNNSNMSDVFVVGWTPFSTVVRWLVVVSACAFWRVFDAIMTQSSVSNPTFCTHPRMDLKNWNMIFRRWIKSETETSLRCERYWPAGSDPARAFTDSGRVLRACVFSWLLSRPTARQPGNWIGIFSSTARLVRPIHKIVSAIDGRVLRVSSRTRSRAKRGGNASECKLARVKFLRRDVESLHACRRCDHHQYKKGQLLLTNPRDACETFARFM